MIPVPSIPAPAAPAMPAPGPVRGAELLARTLWAEAGMRPLRAVEAVAALVANRAALAAASPAARLRFAPATTGREDRAALLAAICRAPFLFACWDRRHPRHGLLALAAAEEPVLAVCRRVAARAVAGALSDPTGGATHCHDLGELPRWALGEIPVAEIGGLVFYRLPGEAARRGGREAGWGGHSGASPLLR